MNDEPLSQSEGESRQRVGPQPRPEHEYNSDRDESPAPKTIEQRAREAADSITSEVPHTHLAQLQPITSIILAALTEHEKQVREECKPRRDQVCQTCNWTNNGCLNVGEVGKPNWMCHGCIARMVVDRDRLQAVVDALYAWYDRLSPSEVWRCIPDSFKDLINANRQPRKEAQ
jgi:hypothetical protein